MKIANRLCVGRLCICAAVVLAGGIPASAQEFELVYHEASGSGSARLLDGGDTVFGAGQTFGTTDPSMMFVADDLSVGPGTLTASATSIGESRIDIVDGELDVTVELIVGYFPSSITGGDNPGGLADGNLSSIIEFMMPVEEVKWVYGLDIDDTADFEGSTSVLIENVTQGLELVSLDGTMDVAVATTLSANIGDIIRVTSEMEGFGDTGGPAGFRRYSPDFGMQLTIPEPSTLLLFAPAALLMRRRTRRTGASVTI